MFIKYSRVYASKPIHLAIKPPSCPQIINVSVYIYNSRSPVRPSPLKKSPPATIQIHHHDMYIIPPLPRPSHYSAQPC